MEQTRATVDDVYNLLRSVVGLLEKIAEQDFSRNERLDELANSLGSIEMRLDRD